MTISSSAAKLGLATVALTAMGLAAAAPASAHTNNMYTYLYYDAATESSSYATYSKTDGVATPLPTLFEPVEEDVRGIELANEAGTEIGYADGPYVLDWDHKTGDIGLYISAYIVDYDLEWEFTGLDTLNDGTTVTIVSYFVDEGAIEFPDFVEHLALASVNKGTGELTILVDFTDAVQDAEADALLYEAYSLATDPTTGVTYVFLQDGEHAVYFLPITVSTKIVGEPTLFEAEFLEHGDIAGADFDQADGSLYFHFNEHNESPYVLLRFAGAPSTWATADPTYISTAPAQIESLEIAPLALTIEHTVLAATGSELPILAIVFVGGVAILAGGVTVTVARRRSEVGSV